MIAWNNFLHGVKSLEKNVEGLSVHQMLFPREKRGERGRAGINSMVPLASQELLASVCVKEVSHFQGESD